MSILSHSISIADVWAVLLFLLAITGGFIFWGFSRASEQPDSSRSWLVATTGAVAMIFTFGTPFSYGVFREPLSQEFGIPAIDLSAVFSLMLFGLFIGSGIVGILSTRVRIRPLILAAAAVTAILAPGLFFIDSYAGIALVFGLLGWTLGTVFVLLVSIVPRWFDIHSGMAIGIIFVGNGTGMAILPWIWQFSFSTFGVAEGFFLLISITAATFALAGLVCRRPSWTEQSITSISPIQWVKNVARTRTFQLLFIGIGLSFGWYQIFAGYAVDLFEAEGLTRSAASLAFGSIAGVSIVSRLGSGVAADRIGSRRAFVFSLLSAAAGAMLLLISHPLSFALAVILMGIGLGGTATLYVPLLMSIYDPENDTAIVGIFNIPAGIAALAMPPLGTAMIASFESYTGAIILTAGTIIAGLGLIVRGTTIN